ncbi:MAG TPA: methyltransferase domain-containing protein [Acetobacteraceae bacterium]|nr:methyltransferase domain-containing protein [Acetobacteraceae bacterium]
MSADPEAVREFERSGWNRAAATYEESFATATRQFIPALLDAAAVGPGMRVLDVCCGPGFVAAAAATRGASATGVDFSPAMLAVAEARHPQVPFDPGDAETLPYPPASFDAVVSNFGVHHVPRPGMALGSAHAVLRPGGRIAFTIWAAPADNVAWKLMFDAVERFGDPAASQAPPPGGGFRTPDICMDALREAGFADIRTRRLDATWRHRDGRALVAALQAGTARMAALISAQDPAALPAIIADINARSAPYRDEVGIAVPIAAFVASGMKV